MRWGRYLPAAVGCLAVVAVVGCSAPSTQPTSGTPSQTGTGSGTELGVTDGGTGAAPGGSRTVAAPGPLDGPLLGPDLLVWSPESLPDDVVDEISGLQGITEAEQLSLAGVSIRNERVMTVAAVDPSEYRRFTPTASAQQQDVWDRVAGGEVAIDPQLGKRLQDKQNFVTLGNDMDAPVVHIGAFAPQIPRVDAVVNTAWGEELGMKPGNALLINTGATSPQKVRPKIERLVGGDVSVQLLGPDLDTSVSQTAFLTGGSVAEAVGTFTYKILDGGRIAPEQSWVDENIRTESVPILGDVTCHKVMLPQLRGALTEITDRGLADKIHPGEYAGCYYPRFIAGSDQLSLHSFGIALDLNTPGNQRGTEGEMDREVVDIFKSWGFAWGGDWNYTDPMHFEMNAIVSSPGR